MIRGEKPQDFLQNLAKSNPQLQGLDLSGDLNKTAEDLYAKRGEDIGSAKSSIKDRITQFITSK